ncbi:hypothetical protein M3Y96_00366500 [Aphelenchoides besseyi]|nr:hypothetical protein M3Y96_00366500 [Aphelenchoides besseyi]
MAPKNCKSKTTNPGVTIVECKFEFKPIGGKIVRLLDTEPEESSTGSLDFVENFNDQVPKYENVNPTVLKKLKITDNSEESICSIASKSCTPTHAKKRLSFKNSIARVEKQSPIKSDVEAKISEQPVHLSTKQSDTIERRPKRKHRKRNLRKTHGKHPNDKAWSSDDSRRFFRDAVRRDACSFVLIKDIIKKEHQDKKSKYKPPISEELIEMIAELKPQQRNRRRRHCCKSFKTAIPQEKEETAVSLRDLSASPSASLNLDAALPTPVCCDRSSKRENSVNFKPIGKFPQIPNPQMFAVDIHDMQFESEVRRECVAWFVLCLAIAVLLYVRCERILANVCDKN